MYVTNDVIKSKPVLVILNQQKVFLCTGFSAQISEYPKLAMWQCCNPSKTFFVLIPASVTK